MPAIRNDKYNPVIDLLRIIAILGVILIHTTTKILEYFTYNLPHHQLTLFLNQFPRFAVPLFFLISAFVLELNYKEPFNYFTYVKKRFSRLFLPYLFWSFIYYFFVYKHNSQSFGSSLLLGGASYQLYFIPALFIFYLSFPFIRPLANIFIHKSALSFLMIFQIIILAYDYYYRSLSLPYPISVFLLNIGPFIFGILACRYQKNVLYFVKKFRFLFLICTIILAVLITAQGYFLYNLTYYYNFFYSNWRPSVFVYTLVFGAFAYYFFNRIKLNSPLIKKIASYSFFVYFIHIIFLELLWKYLPHTLLSFPLILFFIVSTLSYLLAFFISKVKLLSQITG